MKKRDFKIRQLISEEERIKEKEIARKKRKQNKL